MKRKILLIFLSIVTVCCLALGISACSGLVDTPISSNNNEIDADSDAEENTWENGVYTVETAYEVATSLGYSGTLEEFIASISGSNGVGISSVALNESGELIVTLSDSTPINLGVIKGKDGSKWYNGTYEDMDDITANVGDYYLTTDTYAVYTYTSEG
ncbi:MAG: hypothetical protein LUI60_02650 [Clostridia bacterium]|nr:hypothetical protein [Clostridia bacterium]